MKNIFYIFIVFVISISSCKKNIELQERIISSFDNGKPEVIEFYEQEKDTQVVKYYKEFYKNEQLKIEGYIKNNERDGHWIYYYENGNKWSEGNYINGLAEGKFIQYYENGGVWMYTFYKHDKKTKAILFNSDSTVAKEVVIN